ncbi:hypothetical protein [Crocosphaera sp. XPORK-15E]|uniref:hypothetical protein n=1 Tax=Crocosphaera sp. XPORK-15E TaxID=3110247 RepID=UPI002B20CEDC|nr:hypothetical protein [Crocosphaera sp. XPORK-15E]MEA5535896.1 hypothetical protein [Crocosphaera sp. XPORK-15E]
MSKKIYFKIGSCLQLQNQKKVLPVTLTISDSKGRLEERSSYLSIMPEQLSQTFNIWKHYIIPDSPRRPEAKSLSKQPLNTDGNISLEKLAENLKKEMNQWLTAPQSWINEKGEVDSKIHNTLEKYSNLKEEIQLFIQTEDRILRSFPWQEWKFLEPLFRLHKNTELSVSATDFVRPEQEQTIYVDARVRILAIFADNELDENNEYRQEEESLNKLEKYGAFIKTLYQPNYSELIETLEDQTGWHIFFFAGHSHSNPDGRIGWLQISWLDDNRKPQKQEIEINELTKWMQKLINDKLQLAIFNSCDGLGLANQLTSLNLPYCIVMRERVDSFFAGTLLKHLLKAFVEKEKSIFASMRYAREQLLSEYDKGTEPSGKSWLPVIVANPEAPELTWDSLFIERRFSPKVELILLVFLIIIAVGLPLSILGEFGSLNTLRFYTQLYPHIIVYPSLFLPLSLYSLYRAFSLIRQKTEIIWRVTIGVFIVSFIALMFEVYSDPVFLFEIKPHSTIILDNQKLTTILSSKDIDRSQIPTQWINQINLEGKITLDKQNIEDAVKSVIQSFNRDNQANKNHFFNIAHSHKIWSNYYSISRIFYMLNYWAIFFCAFEFLAFLVENIRNDNSVFNFDKYIKYIFSCYIGLLLWIPFDNYYTQEVKHLLFQTNQGGNLRSLVHIFIIFFLSIITYFIYKTTKIKILKHKIIVFFMFVTPFIAILLLEPLNILIINKWFGFLSKSLFITWSGLFCFLMILIYPIIKFLIDGKSFSNSLLKFNKLIKFLH